MKSFQTVMRDWARMCKRFDELKQKYGFDSCLNCPIEKYCHGDSFSAKSMTGREFENMEAEIEAWADGNPEPVYPTWAEWLVKTNFIKGFIDENGIHKFEYHWDEPIPAETAERLGLEPKEEY